MNNKVKIIVSLILISLSVLTSILMTVFVVGCSKLNETNSEARHGEFGKVRHGEPQNLGNSPTLEEIVEVAEGMEER